MHHDRVTLRQISLITFVKDAFFETRGVILRSSSDSELKLVENFSLSPRRIPRSVKIRSRIMCAGLLLVSLLAPLPLGIVLRVLSFGFQNDARVNRTFAERQSL
jgi:hypothetical protein